MAWLPLHKRFQKMVGQCRMELHGLETMYETTLAWFRWDCCFFYKHGLCFLDQMQDGSPLSVISAPFFKKKIYVWYWCSQFVPFICFCQNMMGCGHPWYLIYDAANGYVICIVCYIGIHKCSTCDSLRCWFCSHSLQLRHPKWSSQTAVVFINFMVLASIDHLPFSLKLEPLVFPATMSNELKVWAW